MGDLHLREALGYSDLIQDHRISEKKEILDFIVEQGRNCDQVVFLGDQLNGRNNSSEVIREFVEFIERFKDKEIFILGGNHEKKGDGKSAIDFLREIDKNTWHIVTKEIENHNFDGVETTFCPYLYKSELGVNTDAEGTKKIMKEFNNNGLTGDILFVHHAISDTVTTGGCQTNIFEEIILPKKELEKKYKLVVGGHIHKPQQTGRTIVAGSIFNNECGENGKNIWIIDTKTMNVEEIKLPGRGIFKLENPTNEQLEIGKNNIVKVVLTEKRKTEDLTALKEKLEKFDGHTLLEQYPSERKKIQCKEDLLNLNIEELLSVYAKQKKIPLDKLKLAWEIIK